MSFPRLSTLRSSTEDIEDKDVEEGDWRGLRVGEAAAVEGDESTAELAVRRKTGASFGTAVDAIGATTCVESEFVSN